MLILAGNASGKTRAFNSFLKELAIAFPAKDSICLAMKGAVVRSTIVLDAFGNAATPANANSSRYGKQLKVST
jgi:myosin heavy subunit